MSIRYDDIGDRLRAFRLGSGLSGEEIATRLGISRTALYRLEKGEIVKIETLERLVQLLGVSLPTLLGVGMEFIASAVTYFERMRQIEETAERIVVLAGPISYVLSSDGFDSVLPDVLTEGIANGTKDRARALEEIREIMIILKQRKAVFRQRRPAIVNLISAREIQRFLRNGLVGAPDLPAKLREKRLALARLEVEHLHRLLLDQPIGVQIGIAHDILPHAGFQIFRQPDRELLSLSPFRLGEEPNIRVGVAMITSAPEALSLHNSLAEGIWKRALKGRDAGAFLAELLRSA